MKPPRRKIGAPPKRKPKPGERFQLGVRVTPEMKGRLEAAAEESGRSLSQEAELRLVWSFQSEDVLTDALALRFARAPAGIIRALAEVMHIVGYTHMGRSRKPQTWLASWTEDAASLDIGLLAGIALLVMLRPPAAKLVTPRNRMLALMMASGFLEAVLGEVPKDANADLRGAVQSIRALLGPELLDQIKGQKNDDLEQGFRSIAALVSEAVGEARRESQGHE